ncbi:efflux RND transporter periplasmic adaptor subunit [Aureimonas pseudogalii]|uniref:Multidrug efflux pump subunit AcrA (Membrane-fusion protein) n=1 Tax=Aureimonas pseudogalii TaxID=1744844 RepID=A0A7W6ECM1_9HYPH|nr:efflux RND transporter periplasmic adaptor subunit [Aureimonas pseudogalii]MBB3997571.1 multidrug efflux pump subunit AcrA (membrane-fusion protein) [Aureimonas pseudogalii]
MGFKAVRIRRAACALAFVSLVGAAPALAQSGGSQAGGSQSGGSGPGTDGGGEAERPSVDLPIVGRIPLPGFLAGLFDGSDEAAGQSGGAGGDGAAANAEPPAVIVETIQTQSVGDTLDFIGTVQPIEQVGVRARVDGYIQAVAFEGGQRVKAGDLLYQIEPAQYEAALRAAEAQQSGAQATLNQTQRNFERQQGLAQSGVTARATLDDATAQLENAQASLLQAQAAVTQAQLDLSYTRIEAAIDGVMSAPLITRGNYVSTTTASDLATLTQLDPIWGVFPVGEGQLVTWRRIGVGEVQDPPIAENGQIDGASGGGEGDQAAAAPAGEEAQGDAAAAGSKEAGGQANGNEGGDETVIASADGTGAAGAPPPPAGAEEAGADPAVPSNEIGAGFDLNLRLPNGARYQLPGTFDFVGNTVNASTGTVETRISFPNPNGILLANQNVTLVASEKNPPVLPVVPQAAIQLSREGRSVLLVDGEGTVRRQPIETGKTIGNLASVTQGLSGGETVIVRGAASAKDGAKVRPLSQAEADAEAQARRANRPAGNGEGGGGGAGNGGGEASGGTGSGASGGSAAR